MNNYYFTYLIKKYRKQLKLMGQKWSEFKNTVRIHLLNSHSINCFGAPGGIRTPDLPVRSRTLYPTKLLVHTL